MTVASRHILFSLVATLVATAVVVCAGAAHAQQVDDSLPPLADLTIASEYETSDSTWPIWVVTVKNETVGAHPGMHVRLVKVRFTISDPVRGDTTSIWTIRNLLPGGSVRERTRSLRTRPAATDGPEKVPQRFYAEIIESDPVELPRFRFNNATEHWAIENRREVWLQSAGQFVDGVNRYTNGNVGLDVASISDRYPQQGGATTFTVAAKHSSGSITGVSSSDRDHTLFDVQVEISLSPGLSFAANQPDAPSSTTFDATTGNWDIGTLSSGGKLPFPVAVNLSADSLVDLPLEERCLTAKVVNSVPWFASRPLKRQNDTATACLGKALLTQGETTLFHYLDCVGVSSTPCTSTDMLELVVGYGDDYLQPTQTVVHISDPQGRHDRKWRTGKTTRHDDLSVPDTPGVQALFSFVPSGYTQYHLTISDVSPKQRPGAFSILGNAMGTFQFLDADTKTSIGPVDLGASFTSNPYPAFLVFGALGTYKLNLTVGATKSGTPYQNTGTYTFHVGPMADLKIRDAGASSMIPAGQRAFVIEALNRGPNHRPPVQVSLAGLTVDDIQSHQASLGTLACNPDCVWTIARGDRRGLRSVGRTVNDPNGEFLVVSLSAGAPSEVTATIAFSDVYAPCIAPDGTDAAPEGTGANACTAAGGDRHETDWYDPVVKNNEATIAAQAGTGEWVLNLEAQVYPQPTAPITVVRWDPMEEEPISRRPVSHYEVWATDASCRLPASGDTPERADAPVFVDYLDNPNEQVCYYVRSVNDLGEPGLWSEKFRAAGGTRVAPELSVRPGPAVDEGEIVSFTVNAFPTSVVGEGLTVNYTVSQRGDFVAVGDLGRKSVPTDGQGEARILVPTQDDRVDEVNGVVTVTLDNGDGYVLSSSRSASVQVRDDETSVVNFLPNQTAASVIENVGRHDVAVAISPAPAVDLTIDYAIGRSSTADAGDDFRIAGLTGNSGSVTAPAGADRFNIPVQVVADGLSEEDETIVLKLEEGDNYDLHFTAVTYTLTIEDDDGTGASFDAEKSSVGEGESSIHNVRVNLIPAPTESIDINYSVSAGPARVDDDYTIVGLTGNSGSVTAPANASSVDIPVQVKEDTLNEGDETVELTLRSSADYSVVGATRRHTLTILDNDRPRASFVSGASSYAEDDAGPHSVTVRLVPPAPTGGLTLRYGVSGTANRGGDYTMDSYSTVTVPADTASVEIPVTITDDSDSEPAETVELTLRAGSDYTVGAGRHILTITDDDLPVIAFAAAAASVGESADSFRAVITLDPRPHEDIIINYSVAPSSTATSTADYTIDNSGSVTARAGADQAEIPISINDDKVGEADETVTLTLQPGNGYTLGTQYEFMLTIEDNDAPVVSFRESEDSVIEGTPWATVNVQLSHPLTSPLTINYDTRGRATPGMNEDYTIDGLTDNAGSVEVQAGATSADFRININDDTDYEGEEMVVLALTEGLYTLGTPDVYQLTINDDEPPPPDARVVSFSNFHAHGGGLRECEVYESYHLCRPAFLTYGGDLLSPLAVVVKYVGGTATFGKLVQGENPPFTWECEEGADFCFWGNYKGPEGKGETFTVEVRANAAGDWTIASDGTVAWIEGIYYVDDGKSEGSETITFRLVDGPGYKVDGIIEFTINILDG